jgi:ssDNA-binding Zn-finger/Zn-ribbon topoisomerase 1
MSTTLIVCEHSECCGGLFKLNDKSYNKKIGEEISRCPYCLKFNVVERDHKYKPVVTCFGTNSIIKRMFTKRQRKALI